ncbi:MAG: ABC transporter permease [Spirochaetales bacterium]|nr:ABC transporter permease [Spirochaetales bacterium]
MGLKDFFAKIIKPSLGYKPQKTDNSPGKIHLQQFKKHRLGMIGFFILAFFFFCSLFADLLSPYSMTWTDKKKSFHPPSEVHLFYTDEKNHTFLRPFCYEMKIVNVAYKRYSIIPEHSLRVVSLEKHPKIDELRIIAVDENPEERKQNIISKLVQYYKLVASHSETKSIQEKLDNLVNNPQRDIVQKHILHFDGPDEKELTKEILLIKGNKNFLGFFNQGIPYHFLGLFVSNIHFFGSTSGGYYPLGGDQLGRDVLSRLLHGSRISLSVGLIGILISFTIGLLIGGISGYFGGFVDIILMRVCEIILSFPSLILLYALRASFPPNLNSIEVYFLIIVIMSLINWAALARIIRGMVLSLKNEEYVLNARVMGLSHFRIITRHILRNIFSFIIVQATISIPGYIIGESSLSLLGLGINDPQSSWGLMLSVGRNTRYIKDFPWLLIPGVLIFLTIMAWNFLGDGLRDTLDPHGKKRPLK